jgi:hypothetical protein
MDKSLSYLMLAGLLAGAACSPATQDLGNSNRDLATPDGGSPADPTTPTAPVPEAGSDVGDSEPVPGAKRVFVTSLTYTGDLASEGKAATGLLGADNICNEHAKAANLGGNWVAWVSTSTEDAIDRVPDVGPWYFVDRTTKVFPSKFYIKDGPLVPLVIDERGLTLEGPGLSRLYVWTGTDNSGRHDVRPRYYAQGVSFPIDGCSDWTSAASGSTGGVHARASYGQASTATWTDSGTGYDGSSTDCSQRLHLHCFEK